MRQREEQYKTLHHQYQSLYQQYQALHQQYTKQQEQLQQSHRKQVNFTLFCFIHTVQLVLNFRNETSQSMINKLMIFIVCCRKFRCKWHHLKPAWMFYLTSPPRGQEPPHRSYPWIVWNRATCSHSANGTQSKILSILLSIKRSGACTTHLHLSLSTPVWVPLVPSIIMDKCMYRVNNTSLANSSRKV